MGNPLAFAMLFLFPVGAVAMYQRWDPLKATFWTLAGGYMLLPVKVAVDLPVIPAFDKETIPPMVAIVCLFTVARRPIQLLPSGRIVPVLFVISVLSPLFTVANNGESIITPERFIPGLTLYDALSSLQNAYLELLPFLVGMLVVRTQEDLVRVVRYVVIAGLIYSPFILLEVRISPQLHAWVYGFFPHSFAQMMRAGGFRPVVFMGHGLLVAIFICQCCIAATVLYRLKLTAFPNPPLAQRPILILGYLFAVLVVCKSSGSLLLGIVGVAPLAVLSPRLVNAMTTVILMLVISYPLLSFTELFPHEWLLEKAFELEEERGRSLEFRFNNEEALLGRAMEKPLFGWGGYGRSTFDDSTTDGYWIITAGTRGLVGFFTLFGTMAMAVLAALKASRRKDANREVRFVMTGFALIGTVTLVDQLPNASLNSYAIFLFGVMLGGSRVVLTREATDQSSAERSSEPGQDTRVPEVPAVARGPTDAPGASAKRAEKRKGSSVRDHFLGR